MYNRKGEMRMERSDIARFISEADDVRFEFVLLRSFYRVQSGFGAYHTHRMYELHTVEQGELRILLEGKEHRLHEGELFLIPPGKVHVVLPEQNTVRFGFWFSFSGNAKKDGSMDSYLRSVFPFDTDYILLDDMASCCSEICRTLKRFYSGVSDYMTAQLLQTALLSAADAVQPLPDIRGSREASEEDSIRIIQMEEFLNENYMRHIPLSEVAEMFRLSEKQTERMLLRLFHAPLHVLIGEKRLTIAKFLLQRTELPIEEIASSTGFGTVSYFYRRFRAAMNMTPLEYRNRKNEINPINIE